MKIFLDILNELAEFTELCETIRSDIGPIGVGGATGTVAANLIFGVCEKLERGGLVIARSEAAAIKLYRDLCFFAGSDRVLYYNSKDLTLHDTEAKSRDISSMRLSVLNRLIKDPKGVIVVASPEALLSVTFPYERWSKAAVHLEPGDEVEIEDLAYKLVQLGYTRENTVEGVGQFSVRGGIVDIFPCGCEYPFRAEFFDTEVDSVRIFDHETQRTIDMADGIDVIPAAELVPEAEELERLKAKLESVKEKLDTSTERGSKCFRVLSRDIERIETKGFFPSLDLYIPFLYGTKGKMPTVMDYMPEDFIVFADELPAVEEHINNLEKELGETLINMYEAGNSPLAAGDYTENLNGALKKFNGHSFVELSGILRMTGKIKHKRTFSIDAGSTGSFGGRPDIFKDTLKNYKENKYRTLILAGTAERAKHICQTLADEGILCSFQAEPSVLPDRGGIIICAGSIEHGFEYPLIRVAVIGDREVFGNKRNKKKEPLYRGKKGDKISDFTTLNPGDYVVHRNHGIGRFDGIEQLAVQGLRKDYIKIIYKDGGCLYVPTDQMDMVYRYDKNDGTNVRLNSLSSGDWAKTKQRVKAAAADMAKKLVELYAKRVSEPGIAFAPDTEWQRDFEAAFPYDETEDQLRSIEEVKKDMENPHPMDRLLCGDVGYGKTEVAIRAAFKAVMSGYQVAYLVPTTILANQHYNTFKQRMMEYPAEIRMLSRFCTPAQQKRIFKQLETGEADIVIGTHKLFNKNLKFKKLGLLIIDEEQRFGVAHKEKLKELKRDVDVLTLSATPIPRTLHMSLSGIRDMSIINQPPGNRHPVETYVMEYDETVLREAMERELARGGQVYYLFNRVEGIYKAANRIAELVPDANVAVAHGKMSERELETVMMELAEGEIDILVCTTIIETGLDVGNVNTIIIENSDRLGLSQMYQLRGRVGRSNRVAYAYLTFKRNKQLTEESEKRLLAMKEFTEFGSGFKIAMRDLEIRGTGNLIGAEQSGHMESVGYEMYCRLLEEAVSEEKGTYSKTAETTLDLPVSAYIPDGYISDYSRRIGAYKRIAAISDRDGYYDVYDEIEDRFGTIPQSVENLMEIALIKSAASKFGISDITGREDEIAIKFDSECTPDLRNAVALMSEKPKKIRMTNPSNPVLHYKIKKPSPLEAPKYLKEIGEFVNTLVIKPEE